MTADAWCAEGNASFQASGSSNAVATARSFAAAYAFALGSAEDCNRCKNSASFVASEFEALVVEATASLEFRLTGASEPGAPASAKFDEFIAEFVEVTASAFASVCPRLTVMSLSSVNFILCGLAFG